MILLGIGKSSLFWLLFLEKPNFLLGFLCALLCLCIDLDVFTVLWTLKVHLGKFCKKEPKISEKAKIVPRYPWNEIKAVRTRNRQKSFYQIQEKQKEEKQD